jgi:phosphoribosylglycinamide formyltransferase-1
VAVVSNKPDVFALQRADAAGVPAVHVGVHPGEERSDYDARLADVVAGFDPDLVVLAGWMRILTMSFLGWFPERVVNLHPALPGDLPGTRAIERAWDEALEGSRTTTGVMVHLVPDSGVDDGPLLAQEVVTILPGETLEQLEYRIHQVEHRLLVSTPDIRQQLEHFLFSRLFFRLGLPRLVGHVVAPLDVGVVVAPVADFLGSEHRAPKARHRHASCDHRVHGHVRVSRRTDTGSS